ncbi:dihydrolipoamide acetyltransferase family protein [Salinispora arenicola]|uniref:dihydrolipoamide acetyltransferase family protein n=1 Tax=Salinispora arenicola TaxID=168697 RepID=UPI0016AEBA19|nr:dihydrolipoamide acetyltransferase family protein [Salinispora arenicola]NIL62252.1 2-oxo acid dehydrogenase subunit E2 [Salinispora arenicola]
MGGGLMSERVFLLPDLGEGLSEAEIVEWRVAVGDTVSVDQAVVEVETAKAVVDVPCPYAGRVVALHGTAGEVRPVGQPLITIAPLDVADGASGEPAGHAVYREEERAGSGNVLVGYGAGHGATARRRRRPRPAPGGTAPGNGAGPSGGSVRVISPIVRRLAKQRGVDLAALRGTGRGGVIRRADVEAAVSAPAVAVPNAQVAPGDGDVIVPLTGIRKVIADKLARSRREIPEVTIWVDADATALLETRAAINAATPGEPVSILALFARICLSGLRKFPELNARVDSAAQRIVQSAGVHLGIAAQTDRGLVVPVLRDAQRLTTAGLAAALAETTAAARAGTLPPTRLTGGTFTLNNYGVFGVDGSTPIINHPEAALLGVGRIVDKPWVVDGQLAVRKVTQISLTFDHRVCDGGVAGGFLRHVADCVERPPLLIANI